MDKSIFLAACIDVHQLMFYSHLNLEDGQVYFFINNLHRCAPITAVFTSKLRGDNILMSGKLFLFKMSHENLCTKV